MVVRPLVADDWEGLFAAASDPEVWRVHPAHDRYQEPVFREFFDGALQSGSAFVFVDKQSERVIGSSRYHGLDESLSEVEIGWTFLARSHWGGEYNKEIKRLMLEHAFRYVETVVFWVGETNAISMRAMEKIGGQLREETQTRYLNDVGYVHVIFEITRENFLNDSRWRE